MNLTLHLTHDCNMACSYCVREKYAEHMSEAVLYAACDLAFSSGTSAGLCFFGGEPMLCEDLIVKALDYCDARSKETGIPFQCKMTTNGTLLHEAFLRRAAQSGMKIGLSFDGTMQDCCRHFQDGSASRALVEEKARLLLSVMPRSYGMITAAPEAIGQYAESVQYLHELGFQTITGTIAYGKNVCWTDEHIVMLEQQLRQIAGYYATHWLAGRPFYFSALDSKIREAIQGYNPAERCHLGLRQMPVTPDGRLYACTQFIGDEDYCLGDVFSGIDVAAQRRLAAHHSTPDSCKDCTLRTRCTHSCGCLNRLETGDENNVSPLQCTYERLLIEIADEMADRLYDAAPERFAQYFR